MGRRRTAVYVFGTGESIMSDCPGKRNRTRVEKNRKRPHPPLRYQTEGEASAGDGTRPTETFYHQNPYDEIP